MSIGIYKITNPKGKIYVGKSKNIKSRFNSYKKLQHCKSQIKLYNSLKKYGPKNHIFEIIEECKIENLNIQECFWIKKLNSVNNGLNLTWGGDGGNLSEESEKLRIKNLSKNICQYDLDGNFIKEWEKANDFIKEIGKGNSNNINDCARGKYHKTYGYRWKYSEDVINITDKLPPIKEKPKGSKWTNQRRKKYSKSRQGEKRNKEYKEKIKKLKEKPVYQYNDQKEIINIFPSFSYFNKSGIIGTSKLRKIINKNISFNGLYYSYKKPNR